MLVQETFHQQSTCSSFNFRNSSGYRTETRTNPISVWSRLEVTHHSAGSCLPLSARTVVWSQLHVFSENSIFREWNVQEAIDCYQCILPVRMEQCLYLLCWYRISFITRPNRLACMETTNANYTTSSFSAEVKNDFKNCTSLINFSFAFFHSQHFANYGKKRTPIFISE